MLLKFAFANILMGKVESQILNQSAQKPLAWKRYIDDIFYIWNINKDEVTHFIEEANGHHPTIKRLKFPTRKQRSLTQNFTKAKDLHNSLDYTLHIKTHFKASKRFQYMHFLSCHPQRVKKGFIQSKPFRLPWTNSFETALKTAISQFKTNLIERGHPETLISTTLPENSIWGEKTCPTAET